MLNDFKLIDETDGEEDFERVVSKLEVFVITDSSIFDQVVDIGGVPTQVSHPDKIDSPTEKWIDLRSDKTVYLKITYDKLKNVRKPISDLNFYKISKF